MNEVEQKRILNAADMIDNAITILGEAAERIMREIEEQPDPTREDVEDVEYEAAFSIMALVECIDSRWDVFDAVKKFASTPPKEFAEPYRF